MKKMDSVPYMNIHGQDDYHAPARIVCNEDALMYMYYAMPRMMASNKRHAELVMYASDGEAYRLHIDIRDGNPCFADGTENPEWRGEEPDYEANYRYHRKMVKLRDALEGATETIENIYERETRQTEIFRDILNSTREAGG